MPDSSLVKCLECYVKKTAYQQICTTGITSSDICIASQLFVMRLYDTEQVYVMAFITENR